MGRVGLAFISVDTSLLPPSFPPLTQPIPIHAHPSEFLFHSHEAISICTRTSVTLTLEDFYLLEPQ